MRLVPWIPPLFRDRAEAGKVLADAVGLEDPIIVGVARGGVAVAVEVARALGAPLTAVDVERVNAHGLRLGATTAHGPPYLLRDAPAEVLERARRAAEAARVVAATPVGHVRGLALVETEADAVICPHPLEVIAVVGQAYDIFDPLDEWYVAGLLADA